MDNASFHQVKLMRMHTSTSLYWNRMLVRYSPEYCSPPIHRDNCATLSRAILGSVAVFVILLVCKELAND